MKQRKQDLLRCLTWLRNGICFCFTWLALLALILCRIRQIPYMSVDRLLLLLLFVCGGTVLFCLWFSPFPFRKMRFFHRLTGFFCLFVPYELLALYRLEVFHESETTLPMLLAFLLIALALYLLCLFIDRTVCERKGREYTQRLKRYQMRKETENHDHD